MKRIKRKDSSEIIIKITPAFLDDYPSACFVNLNGNELSCMNSFVMYSLICHYLISEFDL